MPRSIVLGNDRVHVNFDSDYQLRDFYYPNVGMENHSGGHVFRFGVWVDGTMAWASSPDWKKSIGYAEPATLVSDVTFTHATLGIELKLADCVDFHEDLFIRRITVRDLSGKARSVRVFFHHDFHLYGYDVGDTAAFDPKYRSVTHYKDRRYFLVNVVKNGRPGVDQFAAGVKEAAGREGTWRDAEDGTLSENAIAQGAVDSTVAAHLELPASGTATCHYLIAIGKTWQEVTELHKRVLQRGPESYLKRTADYWNVWVRQGGKDFDGLSPTLVKLYQQSLLILRTHLNYNGAVLAANDSDILRFARDTYCYMWPRDAALVIYALDLAGYGEAARRFYKLCGEIIQERGFFLHKYNPDGTLGSSWHPWLAGGEAQLPIQEDETALVLWALWEHFRIYGDVEFVKPLYRPLIKASADFMASYVDEKTGLPLPSWDLWEERRGVMSYTAATVVGGLRAAANFTEAFGEHDVAQRYRDVANRMRQAMDTYLWREDQGRFARLVTLGPRGEHAWDALSGAFGARPEDAATPPIDHVDTTLDSSLWGLFAFGAYEATDPRIARTMAAVFDGLKVKTDVGGIARYTNDYYHRVTDDLAKAPGNPWVICTLWQALYEIARAKTLPELDRAIPILDWVAHHALSSGVLPEQADPFTGDPLSVSPLAWSHATVVTVVREYLRRRQELGGASQPHEPAPLTALSQRAR
jgi:GH15 family glucan-1,4-alpha-glucosidase